MRADRPPARTTAPTLIWGPTVAPSTVATVPPDDQGRTVMDVSQGEQAWLKEVGARLAAGDEPLAPLTSYLIGRAAGRADARGEAFDLRGAVDAISELAAGWEPAPEG